MGKVELMTYFEYSYKSATKSLENALCYKLFFEGQPKLLLLTQEVLIKLVSLRSFNYHLLQNNLPHGKKNRKKAQRGANIAREKYMTNYDGRLW